MEQGYIFLQIPYSPGHTFYVLDNTHLPKEEILKMYFLHLNLCTNITPPFLIIINKYVILK